MPYLTPDTPTDNIVVQFTVPNTLLPSIMGAIARLWDPYVWEAYGTATIPETTQLVGSTILSVQENPIMGGYPNQVIVPVLFPTSYGGAFTRVQGWGYFYHAAQISNQNSYLEYPVLLGPGTWKADIVHDVVNNCGIVTPALDGTGYPTFDCYNGVDTDNVINTVSNIVVASGGVKLFRLTVASKRAASSGYNFECQAIIFTLTGA